MAITSSERLQIEKLLVLMFNAAPGADYLAQVVGLYEALGHNLQGVAKALDDIPAFQSLHPNFQTGAEFAADFLTPFALQDDATARDFVIAKINAGVSKGDIAFQALQALTNLPAQAFVQYQNAKAILENKAAVADYYSAIKGISQSDVAVLQTVLNGITADPASVTSAEAEIDAGTRGVPGQSFTLSATQSSVVGTNASDSVHGLFGGTDATYTAGDSIDGAGGIDHLQLVATGTAPAAAVIVKNVEFIDIQDTVGATFNALLVENNPAITFGSTLAGQTSRVINGALGSTIGLSGQGNLTVDYASTSGPADVANIALAGAGTSASAMSTVDVGDGNTVEAVNIATSGKNFVNLLAGTAAATVTVTGDGANTFTIGSIKATSTIDAAASTGTNTFDVGTGLTNGDVIKGGSGADTVKFATASALGVITLAGVETLSGKVDADVAMNLGTSTGLKTLTLAGGSGSVDVTNAPGTLATVNYASVASGDTDNDFSLSYAKGQTGNVALNLGSATSTTGFDLDSLSFIRAAGLAVNVLGAQDISLNGVHFDDTTKSVAIGLADGSELFSSVIDTPTGSTSALKTVTVSIGDDASLNTSIQAPGAEQVTAQIDVGAGGILSLNMGSMQSVGDVTLNAGKDSQAGLFVDTGIGAIDDVSASYGSGSTGFLSLAASGDIGNLSFELASGAVIDLYNQANVPGLRGDIGDITVDVGRAGKATLDYAAVAASGSDGKWDHGGNIGDISLHAHGDSASISASIAADSDYPGGGGNIGNIDVGASGSGAQFDGDFAASGGSIGDVTVHLDAGAQGTLVAGRQNTDGGTVSMGDVQLVLGDETQVDGTFAAHEVGTFSLEAGNDVKAVTSALSAKGSVGDAAATFGDDAQWSSVFLAPEGKVGALDFTAGDNAHLWIDTIAQASFGAVNGTVGAGAEVTVARAGSIADKTAVGDITLTGGEDGVAHVFAAGGTLGVVDLHGWQGTADIVAGQVSSGTTFIGAVGASSIVGTQGADQITTGAGNDTVFGGGGADVIAAGNGNDIVFGGAGGDVLDGGAGNDFIQGDQGVDALTGGAGADTFSFSASTLGTGPLAFASATVTDVITDFVAGTDRLGFDVAGSAANYAENLTPFLKLSDLLDDANAKLDGTFQYYFGVVGGSGYLVHSTDGLATDSVIQLTGLSNMDSGDIAAL